MMLAAKCITKETAMAVPEARQREAFALLALVKQRKDLYLPS